MTRARGRGAAVGGAILYVYCREVASGKASWRRWHLERKVLSWAQTRSLGIHQQVFFEHDDAWSSVLSARLKAE